MVVILNLAIENLEFSTHRKHGMFLVIIWEKIRAGLNLNAPGLQATMASELNKRDLADLLHRRPKPTYLNSDTQTTVLRKNPQNKEKNKQTSDKQMTCS